MKGSTRRRGRRHGLGVLAIIAVMLLGLGGTALAQDDKPYYSDTQAPAQPGGTLSYLLYEDADTLNPVLGQTSIAGQVTQTILEGLTENDPDGNFVPILAAELPTLDNGGVSEDLNTVTWKLRPDVKWSDGEPLTSADVQFTWQAAVDPANGAIQASRFALVQDVQTPDPLTAVVTYKEFNAGYLDQFNWVLPKHASGAVGDMKNWAFNRNPVGTGPFKLSEWVAGDHISVVKNENYREAADGKPYLDGINFLVVPAEEARTAMMIEEDGQIMLWAGDDAEQQIEDAGVATGRIAPGIWVLELRFNLSKPYDGDPGPTPPHPILGDVKVREAMTMAINRERINKELLEGRVFDIDSPLAVGWMACQVEPWTYDPEAAKAQLDALGWRDEDGDGVRESHGVAGVDDGTKMSLNMNGYTGFSTLELVELAVQEDLKAIGVEVKIENQDFAVIFGTWADKSPRMLGDYDLLIYDAGLPAEPGADIAQDFAPDMVPSATNQGGTNIYRWVRDDVGQWIKAANGSPDVNVRRENFCKVATAIRQDIVTFPILQFSEGSVYSNKLHGFTVSTWEWSTWDSENWWLEQ
ncbi:MAG TPA: peptide ABC transporter substrate-binding protein [Thermomicrobiales bacterium]|nr:peptide ABC transporter substrate-binding protein [Thermomicrobiales bacterium]